MGDICIFCQVNDNKNGTGWKDVDVFGADDPETTGTVEGKHYKDAKAGLTAEVYATCTADAIPIVEPAP